MAQLEALTDHLNHLLVKLTEQERKKLLLEIARKIRLSQKTRIAQQKNVDQSKYVPRKNLRDRKGKIKREMFNQIKNAKYLRINQIEQGIAIGFNERISRIARVHQEGLVDRVDHGSNTKKVKYAKRELLGFTDREIDLIEHSLVSHFN